MKKIIRMVVFSGVGIYLTFLWNKGFIIHLDPPTFLETTLLVALAYYLIIPIAKVILLPINILTFGLLSIALYALTFYVLAHYTGFIQITGWKFEGLTFVGINIHKTTVDYLANLFLASFSVSVIIKLLNRLI